MHSKLSRRARSRFFASLTGALLAAWPASAQFQRGTIAGTISDQADAVVAHAKVTLKNLGTNEERAATSDERGDYTFPSLLPGRFQITAEAPGFKTQVISDIQA